MLENSIWKILAFILASYLLFIFPLVHVLERQEDIAYQLAYHQVNIFVDSVRDRGFVSPEMMNGFLERLQKTGQGYEVTIEHLHKKYIPIYDDPADLASFSGKYSVVSEGFYTMDIQSVLFPEDLSVPEDQRIYYVNQGDLFTIHAVRTSPSLAFALKRYLLLQNHDSSKTILHIGGMVQNEDY